MVQSLQKKVMPCVEKKLPHQGVAIIPIRLFDEQHIAKRVCVTQKCELVFVAAAAFNLCGQAQPQRCLSEQIEGDIGDCHVFLKRRPFATPFG